jgi:acarbose 7IV-phosphotransferase
VGGAFDVLVVGGSGVDTVVRVDALPVPLADSVGVGPIRDWVGHSGNGVALGCRALGLTTAFVDFVGDDPQGELIRERLRAAGVEFTPLVSPAGTRRAVNLVDASGRRMSFFDGRDPAGLRMPREVYLPLLERARHAHFSITDYVRHLYGDAERPGVPVSTDLHDWDGRSAHHRDFALRSHLVFLSATAVRDRLHEVMRAILEQGRAEAVVATDGAAGAHLLTRDAAGQGVRHFPAAVPPGPVVDGNGAGDAFACGFLHGRLASLGWAECMVRGAVAGAHACTGEGTHTALIDASTLAARAAQVARQVSRSGR